MYFLSEIGGSYKDGVKVVLCTIPITLYITPLVRNVVPGAMRSAAGQEDRTSREELGGGNGWASRGGKNGQGAICELEFQLDPIA